MNIDSVIIGAIIAAVAAISVPFISKLLDQSKEKGTAEPVSGTDPINNSTNIKGDNNTVITNSKVNVISKNKRPQPNKISDSAKKRQKELDNQGNRGSNNPELHNLNILVNRDKSDEELMCIVKEQELKHGYGWAKKARAELRRRGYDY